MVYKYLLGYCLGVLGSKVPSASCTQLSFIEYVNHYDCALHILKNKVRCTFNKIHLHELHMNEKIFCKGTAK